MFDDDEQEFGALRRRPPASTFVPFSPGPWPAPQPQPTWAPSQAWMPQPSPTWTTVPTWTPPAWSPVPLNTMAGDPTWWEQSFGRSGPSMPAAWGPWLDLSPNVQVRTRRNMTLAVQQHQPGLWSLGEVPTKDLRSVAGDEDGMNAGVFNLLVRAVAKAVAPAIEEISKAAHKGKERANVGCEGGPCRCGR